MSGARWGLSLAAAFLCGCSRPAPKVAESAHYVDPTLCAGCHANIWETYRRTGMARSFHKPAPANTIEDYTRNNRYYHKASDSYFSMTRCDGKYYQRRWQTGFDGKETNVEEKEVNYVMGSGNHVRTYLHRTEANAIVQLPLAWYAENGGYWAINPGYDRVDHQGSRRRITHDCMFCHNAYPETAVDENAEPIFAGRVPEGIDCQRCHGPGSRHTELAQRAGSKAEEVRQAIINPPRLSAERQMEVCMQCHLETTSFRLPNSIQRHDRGPFSYRPGEPLGDFALYFDSAPGSGRDDKFEIVSSAYRLRRSACFLKSGGALKCTSCHDPHNIPHGEEAARHYAGVCRQCHGAAFEQSVAGGKHTGAGDCIGCHMPKRRTDDVVHAVMTDHYIQRRKPARNLLQAIKERHETDASAYHGEVAAYYPQPLASTPENDLYLAAAQVAQKSNLEKGIPRLAAAIEKYHPERAEFYLTLAEGWKARGEMAKALELYQETVRRRPDYIVALRKLGVAWREAGQLARASEALQQALKTAPNDAASWHELGLVYLAREQKTQALAAFEKAVALDPDMPEAYNSLGGAWLEGGDRARAEGAFRAAIRIQPDYAEAHNNLANTLASGNDFAQAAYHYRKAILYQPDFAAARYNYGATLAGMKRYDEAQRQTEEAVRADPNSAEAHDLLGNLLARKRQIEGALRQYREALRLRPRFSRAHLDLGAILVETGDRNGAEAHLRQAAGSPEPAIREDALGLLKQLGR